MNRRLKIEKNYSNSEYDTYEWLALKVQVPYKKCLSKKIKYTYTEVYRMGTNELPTLDSKNAIIDFLFEKYQEIRANKRMQRIISRM